MIPIYLCEDQPELLTELVKLVENHCQMIELDFKIALATTKPDVLLEHLTNNLHQGIYFLDVNLGDGTLNGFELGKAIRQLDSRGFIIYITTYEELLPETFKYRVEALDYIVKDGSDLMAEKIRSSLLEINQLLKDDQRKKRPHFAVERGNLTTYVPLDEILYFETSARKHVINLVTIEGNLEFYSNLNQVEASLSSQFLRVHRAFLVNSCQIKRCDKKQRLIYFQQDKKCFVAKNKLKIVEEILHTQR